MPRSIISSGQVHERTSNPTVNDDYAAGYTIGDVWINTTTNRTWRCFDATLTAAIWTDLANIYDVSTVSDNNAGGFDEVTMNNVALSNRINAVDNKANDSNPIFFNPSGADYIKCTSTTPQVRASYIYRGTSVWTPDALLLIVSRSTARGVGYFRLYDFINVQLIKEVSFTNTTKQILTFLFTPSEKALLPTGQTILEFQLYRSGGFAGRIYLHAAGLYTGVI